MALLQAGCSMAMGTDSLPWIPAACASVRDWARGCPLQGGEEGAGAGKVSLSAGLRTACTTGTEAYSKEFAECGSRIPSKREIWSGSCP